jgi:hypothetical protein
VIYFFLSYLEKSPYCCQSSLYDFSFCVTYRIIFYFFMLCTKKVLFLLLIKFQCRLIMKSEYPLIISSLNNLIYLFECLYKVQQRGLLLICWWTLCLYFKVIVLNILPLTVLILFSFKWKYHIKHEKEEEKLHKYIMIFESVIAKYFIWSSNKTKRSFILSIYFYIIWISLQQIFNISTLFILLGTISIVWNSNWIIIQYITKKIVNNNEEMRLWNQLYKYQQEQSIRPFVFELYENQVKIVLVYYCDNIINHCSYFRD